MCMQKVIKANGGYNRNRKIKPKKPVDQAKQEQEKRLYQSILKAKEIIFNKI